MQRETEKIQYVVRSRKLCGSDVTHAGQIVSHIVDSLVAIVMLELLGSFPVVYILQKRRNYKGVIDIIACLNLFRVCVLRWLRGAKCVSRAQKYPTQRKQRETIAILYFKVCRVLLPLTHILWINVQCIFCRKVDYYNYLLCSAQNV